MEKIEYINKDKMLKLFKRYLKENNEIHLLKETNIIESFKEQILTLEEAREGMNYSYIMFNENNKNNNNNSDICILDDYYHFLYSLNNRKAMMEISHLLEYFLKKHKHYDLFIKELKEHNKKLIDSEITSVFKVVNFNEKEKPIVSYTKSRSYINPIEMIRYSFPWTSYTSKGIDWGALNRAYEAYIRSIILESQTV